MNEQKEHYNEDLCHAISEAFAGAKTYQNYGIAAQILLFGLGVLAIFWPDFSPSYPPLAIVAAAILAFLRMRTNFLKGVAESLKRAHEFLDGFGIRPSATLLADLTATRKDHLPAAAMSELNKGLQFASGSPVGAKRALENIQESAWWSKSGAARARNLLLIVFAVVLVASIVTLNALNLHIDKQMLQPSGDFKAAAARVVSSTLLCIFSLGLLPGIWGFHRFSIKAAEVDSECDRRLSNSQLTEVEALRIVSEYQIARASAPMIPTCVWAWKRDKMNAAFDRYKARK